MNEVQPDGQHNAGAVRRRTILVRARLQPCSHRAADLHRLGNSMQSLTQICLWILLIAVASHAAEEERLIPAAVLKRLEPDLREALEKAEDDCLAIGRLGVPPHAVPDPLSMRDGGSRVFRGDGYFIVRRQTLLPLSAMSDNRIIGFSYGYELFLGDVSMLAKHPGMRPVLSKVWFVPYQDMNAINQEIREELNRRRPKLGDFYHLAPVEETNPTSRSENSGR